MRGIDGRAFEDSGESAPLIRLYKIVELGERNFPLQLITGSHLFIPSFSWIRSRYLMQGT